MMLVSPKKQIGSLGFGIWDIYLNKPIHSYTDKNQRLRKLIILFYFSDSNTRQNQFMYLWELRLISIDFLLWGVITVILFVH